VVGYLHLCPGGPGGPGFESASLHKSKGKGCLEISFPRPHNVWEISALGTPVEKHDTHICALRRSLSLC
jgi:hypothetical protein